MTTSAIVLAFIIVTLVGYAGVMPLLTKLQLPEHKKKTKLQSGDLDGLESQYRRLLMSIRDVDFDYDTGKITDDVYAEQRKFLIGRSVSLLRQLDGVRSEIADIEDDIEAAIAAKRTKLSAKSGKDKDIEKQISTRRQRRQKVVN